jgi:coenzyme F420-reducing hydrogenase gamma subunit
MPQNYDVALIEGAVTQPEHEELLKEVRSIATTVMAIGACACTAGVPGMATNHQLSDLAKDVYADAAEAIAQDCLEPRPIDSVIPVDYSIPGCPIDVSELSRILQGALLGVAERPKREPLCAYCKVIENPCFYSLQKFNPTPAGKGSTQTPCLGLITQTGCGALCISRGRPCTGCRGIAIDANIKSALDFIDETSWSRQDFMDALRIYNSARINAKEFEDVNEELSSANQAKTEASKASAPSPKRPKSGPEEAPKRPQAGNKEQ